MKLLAELQRNCRKNGNALVEHLKVYDLTELGREVWRAEFEDIENRVLGEHEFYAAKACARIGVKAGDRITDEQNTFLLSDEDFECLQKLLVVEYCKAGLTDDKGYYKENWDEKVCDARGELYRFICENILPESMREEFWDARLRLTVQTKLINITRQAVKGEMEE